MNKKYDVICIGIVVHDIMITNIDENALSRDTTVADFAAITSGGDANNQANILAKFGSKTALLTKVGTNKLGESIMSTFQNEPVDTSLIIRDEQIDNFMAIVVIKPDGERSFLVRKGNSASDLTLADIPYDLLEQTRAITIGSIFSLLGLDGKPLADLLKKAQECGVLTFCDMASDINHIGPAAIDCIYPYVDYMMPSLEEAMYVTNEIKPEAIAQWFLQKGVKNVILKLGKDGCYVSDLQNHFYVDSYSIHAVDTTGCGDNFVAGFTHSILNGSSLKEAAEFANAAGALNATGYGAHSTIQCKSQVLDFMKHTPKRNKKTN